MDAARDDGIRAAVRAWLDHLQAEGLIGGWTLTRRKLGFGPAELGECCAELRTDGMAQLEAAFQRVAARAGAGEELHRAVDARVRNLRTALYRDFPDPQRGAGG